MRVEDLTLNGDFVRLEPLKTEHVGKLFEIGQNKEIWRWTTTNIESFEDMRQYVATALAERANGLTLPFVTIDKASGEIVGSTRFGNISVQNRSAEIGWTWIDPKWQRTYVNTDAKLLMLTHAFENWKCLRVEIITDVFNEASRRAILRLGAKEEGVLRNHLIVETGRVRDSVVFSIIDSEWESVKEALQTKIEKYK